MTKFDRNLDVTLEMNPIKFHLGQSGDCTKLAPLSALANLGFAKHIEQLYVHLEHCRWTKTHQSVSKLSNLRGEVDNQLHDVAL